MATKRKSEQRERGVFRLSWHAGLGAWIVEAGDVIVMAHAYRSSLLNDITGNLREMLFAHGIRSQLVIHAKNGRIVSERTYPDDTPRRKG